MMGRPTFLLYACHQGKVDVVEALVAAGSDVNMQDQEGRAPLHLAATWGSREVVDALLRLGADIEAVDTYGHTPLLVASMSGCKEMVDALLKLGANVRAANDDGFTAAHLASMYGNVEVLTSLLAAGADIEATEYAGYTPLLTAAEWGKVEALEALGIDPVHYLVVPRLVGMSAAVVCLAAYLVLTSLGAGYVVAFIRGLAMTPGDFAGAVAGALSWVDFPLLALKTAGFGVLTSMIICFHGLARPLRMEEVGEATTRTVAHTLVACVVLDGLFVPVYLAL
jgi:predicted LPLAT superfamily acyltransferase